MFVGKDSEGQKIMSAGFPFPEYFRKRGGGCMLCAVKRRNTVTNSLTRTYCIE